MTISYVHRSKDDRAYYAVWQDKLIPTNTVKILDLISAINLACYRSMAMILSTSPG